MDKQMFWDLIRSVNERVDVNDKEKVLQATREALCELSAREIDEWYEIYQELHKAAYRDDLWDMVIDCGIHASDDGFIDFRAWLISRGQAVYEAVMANPRVLKEYVPEPREANFELYGYVTGDAFAEKKYRDVLGNEGFEAFKREWIAQNREAIEENAEWNGASFEQSSEKLFVNMLIREVDMFSLEAKLQKAKEEAGLNVCSLEGKDKDLE